MGKLDMLSIYGGFLINTDYDYKLGCNG